ncbi:MAG: HepT-like ribonuclease domain-containing protein [Cyanobacteria bacterium J06634_5]
MNQEQFEENVEKQDTILRRITIIGEATKRLTTEFRAEHQEIPWKEIAGMRDILSHDYDEVDLEEVWSVIQNNLPSLLTYIQPLVPPKP